MENLKELRGRVIDPSTIFGVVLAFSLIIIAIDMGGNPGGFVDIKSVLIVIFGTFAVTFASFSFAEIMNVPGAMVRTVFYRSEDITDSAMRAVEIAKIARKEGFLGLDKYNKFFGHNDFFRDGIEMIIDHIAIKEIEIVLENELNAMAFRHSKSVSILRKAAEVSPAMGLIGTLIGLVQMLGTLEDASKIGPAMAVALLTTFYGAVLSYVVFSPLASKLERITKDQLLISNIYFQAVSSIAKKEDPRKLELVINGMLPSVKRSR